MALKDSLIAVWCENDPVTEDLFTNGLDLTISGAVGDDTGKVGTAAFFDIPGDGFLIHADDPLLDTGNINFSVAGWFRPDTFGADTYRTITGKRDSGQIEWNVYYDASAARLKFVVSSDGSSVTEISANNAGALATGSFYYFVAYHDATNDEISIRVFGAADDTPNVQSYSSGVHSGSASFRIGHYTSSVDNPGNWDGLINQVAFWKRVVTEAEGDSLYNANAGLPFSEWDAGGVAVDVSRSLLLARGSLALPGLLLRP